MRTGLLSLVVWTLGMAAAWGQADEPKIWDRQIMAQPFDTGPFYQVKIPAWVSETIGCGYTLSGMDTAARERAAAHGVTISEMGFVDPFYAYYDSKLLKRHSPHVPLDQLPKEVAEYKRLGVRILGVYPPSLQGEVYADHPDWRRIGTNTTEIPTIDLEKFPHGGMLCLLGPYGDFFIDVLAEIVTQFPDVDAFSFDGLHYAGVCYCEHCRENFRHDTGQEIPNVDLNDPAFRRYQHWADRRMEHLIQRMQQRLKGIKPEVALVTWTTNAGRFGHFLSIPRNMPARMNLLLDAPDQEFWCDESNRGTTIVPAFANAYMWAVTNHRVGFSEPYLMSHGNPYGKDSFPPEEIERRMMLALTHGAAPSIAVGQPPQLQPAIYDCLDQVQRRKPWLVHKRPEPWGAMVMSDNTRNFYGRSSGEVEQRYMAPVLGTFRTVIETHLPVTVINDWNLNAEDLAATRCWCCRTRRVWTRRSSRRCASLCAAEAGWWRAWTCRCSTNLARARELRAGRRAGRGLSRLAGLWRRHRRARREFRPLPRAGLLGEAQERVRFPAGAGVGVEPRENADLCRRSAGNVQGPGGTRGAARRRRQDRWHVDGKVGGRRKRFRES